jgi:hypothetical protein
MYAGMKPWRACVVYWQTTSSNVFRDVDAALCGGHDNRHCTLSMFVATPLLACFVVMIPFMFRWCDTDSGNNVDAAEGDDEEDENVVGSWDSRGAGGPSTPVKLPWRLRGRSPRGSSPGGYFLQGDDGADGMATPSSVGQSMPPAVPSRAALWLRMGASLGLALSALTQVAVEARGMNREKVALGTLLWLATSVFSWTSNAWWLLKSWRHKVRVAGPVGVCVCVCCEHPIHWWASAL